MGWCHELHVSKWNERGTLLTSGSMSDARRCVSRLWDSVIQNSLAPRKNEPRSRRFGSESRTSSASFLSSNLVFWAGVLGGLVTCRNRVFRGWMEKGQQWTLHTSHIGRHCGTLFERKGFIHCPFSIHTSNPPDILALLTMSRNEEEWPNEWMNEKKWEIGCAVGLQTKKNERMQMNGGWSWSKSSWRLPPFEPPLNTGTLKPPSNAVGISNVGSPTEVSAQDEKMHMEWWPRRGGLLLSRCHRRNEASWDSARWCLHNEKKNGGPCSTPNWPCFVGSRLPSRNGQCPHLVHLHRVQCVWRRRPYFWLFETDCFENENRRVFCSSKFFWPITIPKNNGFARETNGRD